MRYTHHPRELQSINCLLTLINSKEEEKALTKYYNLIVFLSWVQEICFLLRLMLFTESPSAAVIISLTLSGTAPKHGFGVAWPAKLNETDLGPRMEGRVCLHSLHKTSGLLTSS